jgi:protocatechuate 3,4-dioxygenase beta subunit
MRQAITLEGRAPVAHRSRLVVAAALGVVLAIGGAYAVLRDTRPPPPTSQPAASRPEATAAGRQEPCQPTSTPRASAETADPGPGTPARIRLGPGLRVKPSAAAIAASRRGQRLVVSGTVYAPDCTTPLEGAVVHLWQANGDGVYGPGPQGPGEVRCCYLQGTLRTDARGRYRVETVKPAHYQGANPPPPAHIHLEVSHSAAGVLLTEVHFQGDPYLEESLDSGSVIGLRTVQGPHGPYLHGVFDIVLPGPMP